MEAARAQRMKEREASLLYEMAQVRPDGAPLDVALDTAALLSDTSDAGSLRGSFDLPASASKGSRTHSRKGSEVPNLGTLAEGDDGGGAQSARAGGKSGGSSARSRVGGDEAAGDGANVQGTEGGGDGGDDDGEAKKARRRRRKKKLSFSSAAGEGGDGGNGERVEGAEGEAGEEEEEWTSASESEEEEREPTVSDAVAMLPDLTWAKERMRMYNEMDGLPPEPEEPEPMEEPAAATTALAVVPGEHDEAVKRMGRLLLAEDFFAEAEKLLKVRSVAELHATLRTP